MSSHREIVITVDEVYTSEKSTVGEMSVKGSNSMRVDVGVGPDEEDQTPTPPIVPEGGYGWVVVAASFIIHVIALGNLYTFGVFFPIYIDEFHSSQANVAWIGSIGAALMVGCGLWSGAYADRWGNNIIVVIGACLVGAGFLLASYANALWQLYLTQGILAGIGYSMSFIAGVSVVGQWFHKRRGIAIGIAVAGSGLGQFAIVIVTQSLIDQMGWRSCLRILAAINFGSLLIASLLIRRLLPLVPDASPLQSVSYFQDYNFRVLYASSIIFALGFFMPYTHLPLYARNHGISTAGSVLILSMMGISSAVGRIVMGYLADLFGKLTMLRVCMGGGGVTVICWLAATDFGSLMVIGILYGMLAGGIISMFPSVCAELFGVAQLGSVIGLLYTSNAMGNLISAPLGGFLYAAAHSYTLPIAVDGSFLVVGAFLSLFVSTSYVDQRRHHHGSHEPVNGEEDEGVQMTASEKHDALDITDEREYVDDAMVV